MGETDLISRQAAIDVLEERLQANGYSNVALVSEFNRSIGYLKRLPSAQPELNEWCHDCKEYDKEKHSCPRWNRVIRNTLKDAQPEIIRCKDCEYYELTEWVAHRCNLLGRSVYGNDFCAWAEPYKGEQE